MEIALRIATHADYESVMAINDNIYDCLDYLLSSYHALLDAGNSKAFLCKHNEEVEGAQYTVRVADIEKKGPTAGVSAQYTVRVADIEKIGPTAGVGAQYTGRVADIEKKGPTAGVGAQYTVRVADIEKIGPTAGVGAQYTVRVADIEKKGPTAGVGAQYTVRVADIEKIGHTAGVGAELINVDGALFNKIFSSEDFCRVCFPEDRMIMSWVSYRLVESNIEHITGYNAKILADYQTMTDDKLGKPGLLSLEGHYKCPTSLLYYIAICEIDSSTLMNHVTAHLRHAMQLTSGDITLHFYFETCFPISVLVEVLATFGSKRNNVYYKMMYEKLKLYNRQVL